MSNGIFQTTACKVALELGYTKKAIIRCYVHGIKAGDLVSKILDLEEKYPEFRTEDSDEERNSFDELVKQVNGLKLHHQNGSLLEETEKLWRKQQCHRCWKHKSNVLAIPCTHLVVCENCTSDTCMICKVTVTDWIKVHT